MKKIILTAAILFNSVFAAEIPTHSLEGTGSPGTQTEFRGNWTENFNTKVGLITHTPKHVQMGFMTGGTSININKCNLNGCQLLADLKLVTDSTRAEFVTALTLTGIYNGK